MGPFNGCKETGGCDKRKTALMGTTTQEERVKVLPLVGNAVPQTAQEKTAAKEWRYTLDKQLSLHADKDGYVLLTAVNYEYRDHLMNFICMLNQLGMTDHYLIAALDEKMYAWGVRQGLPIYPLEHKKEGTKPEENETKNQALKSKAVLEILEKGYSVVWSNVDITWFKHPFEALADHMQGYGIAIQSNAPFVSNPDREAKPHHTVNTVQTDNPAGQRRLNPGLYVAPSNPRTVSAFREIVERAAKSDMTEQPHFDEVLCNQNSSDRGYDFCTYRGLSAGDRILKVQLLDRFMFPTGSVLLGDNNENVYNLGREGFMQESGVELIAAHNNWIEGEALKKERQVKAGWWFTDAKDTCFYPGDHTIV